MFKLIGFAHAGGSAASLAPLHRHLSGRMTFHAIDLPGHGARRREPLHSERSALVAQLCAELEPLANGPYALFGHSLGATLAFEVAHALIVRGAPGPSMLFAAAAPSPTLPPSAAKRPGQSDAELIEELKRLGGTPAEVLEQPQLLELCLPIVRADFALCANPPIRPSGPLPCAIHVFGGRRDRVSQDALVAWRRETSRDFSLTWFEADHFFVGSHAAQLCAGMMQRLTAAGFLRL